MKRNRDQNPNGFNRQSPFLPRSPAPISSQVPLHLSHPPRMDTAVTAITHLPSHLGWESQSISLVVRKAGQRCEVSATIAEQLGADHPSSCPMPDRSDTDGQPLGISETAGVGAQLRLPLDGDTVRHYPSIGLAVLQAEQAAPYRVWLLCRYLDEQGRAGCRYQMCPSSSLEKNPSCDSLAGADSGKCWGRGMACSGNGTKLAVASGSMARLLSPLIWMCPG